MGLEDQKSLFPAQLQEHRKVVASAKRATLTEMRRAFKDRNIIGLNPSFLENEPQDVTTLSSLNYRTKQTWDNHEYGHGSADPILAVAGDVLFSRPQGRQEILAPGTTDPVLHRPDRRELSFHDLDVMLAQAIIWYGDGPFEANWEVGNALGTRNDGDELDLTTLSSVKMVMENGIAHAIIEANLSTNMNPLLPLIEIGADHSATFYASGDGVHSYEISAFQARQLVVFKVLSPALFADFYQKGREQRTGNVSLDFSRPHRRRSFARPSSK
jgi:hypothetical protein